jgi:radical SAM protein with 4Fe4S-binding SPASM domain
VNTQDQGVEDLDTETWKRILAAVASYTQCVVIFTGGEPLERSDLFDLLEYARDLGLRAVLATCGYRIDEAILQRLMDVGVISLSLSLDGASAETHDKFHQAPGAFDAVMRTARLAQVAGIPFQITTTLNRMNQTEIIAIAGLIERLGAASFNPIILIPAGRGVDLSDQLLDPVEYETLLNELLSIKLHSKLEINVTCGPQFARVTRTRAEKRVGASSGCMGGRDFGFITRQGDVQTCGYLPIPAGNLIDNGYDFRYIWEDSAVLKTVRDRKQRKGKCSVCEHLEFCGGCRARAFLSSGDVLGEDPICTQ